MKKVSVIISTYARPSNLERAIESVLSQTYKNIEIIVVDDNGEGTKYQKETELLLAKYFNLNNFIYLKHKVNKNGSAARNTGIKIASGDYIAFLDDDDEFLPKKIELQVNALEELDNTWGGCYCNLCSIGRRKTFFKNKDSGNLSELLLLEKVRFNTSCLLIRKDVCLDLNGFDETFTRHQDWEFLIRFFRKYKLCLPTMDVLLNKYSSRFNHSNFPSAMNFLKTKEYFLYKFKADIESKTKPNEIYHIHWFEVASVFLCEKKIKLFLFYLKKSCRYKFLTIRDLRVLILLLIKCSFK